MTRLILIALILGLLSSSAAGQDRCTHSNGQWSFAMPQGWTKVNGAALAEMTRQAQGMLQGTMKYDTLLAPNDAQPKRMQYVLTASFTGRMKAADWQEVEREMAKGIESAPNSTALPQELRGFRPGTPVFDEARKSIAFTAQMSTPGGPIAMIATGFLLRDEVAYIYYYATPPLTNEDLSIVESMASSFVVAPGHQFEYSHWFDGAARGAIIGGAIGLGFGLVTWLRMRSAS